MQRFRAFTLIELLVVIGIIGVLVALLMPALARARQQAEIVACGARLHGAYLAMTMYANQYKDYPVTWKLRQSNVLALLQGEHGGFLGAGQGANDIKQLLVDLKLITDAGLQCTAEISGWPLRWAGHVDRPYYGYSGPSTINIVHKNYGMLNGLEYDSRLIWDEAAAPPHIYTQDPRAWGVSIKNKWRRVFMTCPAIFAVGTTYGFEPHEKQPVTSVVSNQHGDHWNVRRRNYLYNDGSVIYVRIDSNPPND